MKYSSQQGDFSVNLYTLTTEPIDYKASAKTLSRIDWSNKGLYKNINIAKEFQGKEVRKIVGNHPRKHLYFNNFYGNHPNKNKAIEKWTEDVFLTSTNNHNPNSSNMMKGYINWPKTIALILALALGAVILLKLFLKRKAA